MCTGFRFLGQLESFLNDSAAKNRLCYVASSLGISLDSFFGINSLIFSSQQMSHFRSVFWLSLWTSAYPTGHSFEASWTNICSGTDAWIICSVSEETSSVSQDFWFGQRLDFTNLRSVKCLPNSSYRHRFQFEIQTLYSFAQHELKTLKGSNASPKLLGSDRPNRGWANGSKSESLTGDLIDSPIEQWEMIFLCISRWPYNLEHLESACY